MRAFVMSLSCSKSCVGNFSPPARTICMLEIACAKSSLVSQVCQREGVPDTISMPFSLMSDASSIGLLACSSVATTRVLPLYIAVPMSCNAASKDIVVTLSKRLASVITACANTLVG